MSRYDQALALLAGKGETGPEFFRTAARSLSTGLNCRWAGVAILDQGGDSATLLARIADGENATCISYELAGTPCAHVYERKGDDPPWVVPDGLRERFPEAGDLRGPDAVSYCGEIFFDADGRAAGHAFVMNDRPFTPDERSRDFFRLVSRRIGSEYDRWRAEESRKANEAILTSIINAVPAVINVKDREGRFVFANEFARRRHPRAGAGGDGRTIIEVLGPELGAKIARQDRKVFETGRPIPFFELQAPDPDGKPRDWLLTKVPVFDAGGRVEYVVTVGLDVSEQKRAERAAETAHQWLQHAFQSMTDGFALYDKEGRLVLWNARYEELFPETAGLLAPGLAYRDLIAADEKCGQVVEIVDRDTGRRVRHGDLTAKEETRVLKYRTRRGRWIEARDHPIEGGGWAAIRIDITERERADEAARNSRKMLQSVLDTIPVRVFWKDRDGFYLGCNRKFAEDAGLRSPADIVGRTDHELSWQDRADLYREDDLDVIRTGRPKLNHEESRTDRSGRVRWLLSSKVPLTDARGDIIGVLGCYDDITQRKLDEEELRRTQERYELVLKGTNEGIWDWDIENGNIYYSPRLIEITRLPDSRMWRTPEQVLDDVHPDDRKAYRTALVDYLKGKSASFRFEGRVRGGDGKYRWILNRGTALRDGNGRAYRMVGSVIDVTERVEAEEKLRQAQKIEAVGQLTAGLAHDFNNLLAVIIGNLELVMERLEDDPDLRELLASASRAADRGAALTERLLAFSRQQNLRPAVLDVRELIGGMSDILRVTLGETIELEIVEEIGDLWRCRVDATQMENALLNLVVNARDAMPRGGRLTIEIANQRIAEGETDDEIRPGEYVRLTVRDTGVGIPPDRLEHVFEPFYTTKDVGKGSGLGLSMVFGFVKQSGGHVSISSEEGVGTTVDILLPRVEGEALARTSADETASGGRGRGERVLVVEDDAEVRALLATLLRRFGYAVVEASQARSALDLVRRGEPVDLLVTDIVLPGDRDGLDLAAEVRQRIPDAGVLFVSGYNDSADRLRPERGDMLLQKPFRSIDLERKVRAALDRRGKRRRPETESAQAEGSGT